MKKWNLCMEDTICLSHEKLGDVRCLLQDIKKEFFHQYDYDNKHEKLPDDETRCMIAYVLPHYASLTRLLETCIDEIYDMLAEKAEEIEKRPSERQLETVKQSA